MDANNRTTFTPRIQISESEMKVAAQAAGTEENSFTKLLEKSLLFTRVGLTPVYIYDPSKGTIELTSEEKLKNLYH